MSPKEEHLDVPPEVNEKMVRKKSLVLREAVEEAGRVKRIMHNE